MPVKVHQRRTELFRENTREGVDAKQSAGILKAKNTIVQIIEEDFIMPGGKPIRLENHQRRILNTWFRPTNGKLPYHTLVYSTVKKSGKTEVAAMVMYAWAKTYGGDIYSIANDKTQAEERAYRRVEEMFKRMRKYDPDRFKEEVHPDHHKVIAKQTREGNEQIVLNNGARIIAIPCDPYGEAGGMQTLTVWDELWAYRSSTTDRLWTEMQPLPRGVGNVTESARLVVTYAGWYGESELLWNIYEDICKPDENGEEQGSRVKGLDDLPVYESGDNVAYWDHVGRMPWHTPEFLEQARNDPALKGRKSEYLRIWENRWTTGIEPYINMEDYDRLVAKGKANGLYNRFVV